MLSFGDIPKTMRPYDLVLKVTISEDFTQDDLQIVARMPVTVKVEGTGRLQNPSRLKPMLLHPLDIVIDLPPSTCLQKSGFQHRR